MSVAASLALAAMVWTAAEVQRSTGTGSVCAAASQVWCFVAVASVTAGAALNLFLLFLFVEGTSLAEAVTVSGGFLV